MLGRSSLFWDLLKVNISKFLTSKHKSTKFYYANQEYMFFMFTSQTFIYALRSEIMYSLL